MSGHEVAEAPASVELVFVDVEFDVVVAESDESSEPSDAAQGSVALASNDAG